MLARPPRPGQRPPRAAIRGRAGRHQHRAGADVGHVTNEEGRL